MPKTKPTAHPTSDALQVDDEHTRRLANETVSQSQAAGNSLSLDRFIRISEVRHHTSLSTSTLYRKMREGTFPQQIDLGPNMVAWYESQVAAWMENPT